MKISEISVQKRNKNRSNIYVDGCYYCSLDNFTVVKNALKADIEIEEAEFSKMQFDSECETALNFSFDYLSKYRKTEKEFTDKLKENGYLPQIIEFVVEKTKKYNLINDLIYVESYIEFNKHKKGAKLLKFELKSKGIDSEILNGIEIDCEEETTYIKTLIEKFFKTKEMSRDNVQKLYRHLLSKGFSYDSAKNALHDFNDQLEIDDEDLF